MAVETVAAAATPSVYYVFSNSDGVGKAIVLLLVASSILTWTIMIDKGLALWRSRRASEGFLTRFRENASGIIALVRESATNASPVACIYDAGIECLLQFYEEGAPGSTAMAGAMAVRPGKRVTAPVMLTPAQIEAIEAVLESSVSNQIRIAETRIGFLATMVSLSPFLGLFGTVWGVMMAFAGIAAAGKADFNALAPGVAGALLTTVAGLVVAIPSLVGYNMLNSSIRALTTDMDNFAEGFMAQVKLEQVGSAAAPASAAGQQR